MLGSSFAWSGTSEACASPLGAIVSTVAMEGAARANAGTGRYAVRRAHPRQLGPLAGADQELQDERGSGEARTAVRNGCAAFDSQTTNQS